MKLLIIEPEATGHHMALYVKLIVRSAIARGWCIQLLTTKKALEHPAFELVKREISDGMDIFLMDEVTRKNHTTSLSLLWKQKRLYESIASSFSKIPHNQRADVIYVVNFDYFEKILALRGSPFNSVPFIGMMMNVKYHRQKMGIGPNSRSDWLYEQLFRRILRIPTLQSITVIDECFLTYTQQSRHKEYQKIQFVPDVGELFGNESRELARNELNLQQESFVILVYGSLSERKGIKELLKAVSMLGQSQITVLLAGEQDEKIQQQLCASLAQQLVGRGCLIESLGFHDERREYRVFRASDVVWLGYVGGARGSSGVLYQAGSIGLPILATNEGLIGWLTKRHGIGLTVNPTDCHAVARAINQLSVDKEFTKECGQHNRDLAKLHSGEKFGDDVCNAIFKS